LDELRDPYFQKVGRHSASDMKYKLHVGYTRLQKMKPVTIFGGKGILEAKNNFWREEAAYVTVHIIQ